MLNRKIDFFFSNASTRRATRVLQHQRRLSRPSAAPNFPDSVNREDRPPPPIGTKNGKTTIIFITDSSVHLSGYRIERRPQIEWAGCIFFHPPPCARPIVFFGGGHSLPTLHNKGKKTQRPVYILRFFNHNN